MLWSAAWSGRAWEPWAVSEDTLVWCAIAGMAVVTWITRIGGFWLMRLVPEGGMVRRGLDHLPGALVVSILPDRAGGRMGTHACRAGGSRAWADGSVGDHRGVRRRRHCRPGPMAGVAFELST